MGRKKGSKNKPKMTNSSEVEQASYTRPVEGATPSSSTIDMETQIAQNILNKPHSERVVRIIEEVVRYIPEPRLEGFELYRTLKDKTNFPQGGAMGQWMEDPNGIESVYVPHYSEIIAFFMGDPDKMNGMRDAVVRAYIELYGAD